MGEELARDLANANGLEYPTPMIQRALWTVAFCGGNVSKAHRVLVEQEVQDERGRTPAMQTIAKWKNVTFRNTYEEILRTDARKLDELIATQAQQNAIHLGDGIARALEQTLSGLGDANGVEASQILRNIAHARQVEIDKSMQLRGTDPSSRLAQSLHESMKELARFGVVRVVEEDPETGYIEGTAHPVARERLKELGVG